MPSAEAERLFRSRRVVFPDAVAAATVVVADGCVRAIEGWDVPAAGRAVIDCGELALLPGLVDCHVHINEPGRTDWEGFRTATRAAAAGGITTLVDMPLNSIPPTTTVAGLDAKRAAAAGQCHVDVGFWGGVVPGNAADLEPLWRAGALGFKCFLAPSGVPEFPHVEAADLRRALPILARLGAPLLVHAESPAVLATAAAAMRDGDPRSYHRYLESRPPAAEVEAIEMVAALAGEYGVRLHVVHISSAAGVAAVQAARARGWTIGAETCPHYLAGAAEDILDGATQWKCAPPIRASGHREALWSALGGGALDFVVSDHSPSPPAMKLLDIGAFTGDFTGDFTGAFTGDFTRAWGGIASLQVALPVVWTAARRRGFGLPDIARWMATGPAALAGLRGKGSIEPGADADFTVLDPEATFRVAGGALEHRHALTPYEGQELHGCVRQTYLGGDLVYDRGQFFEPRGEPISR